MHGFRIALAASALTMTGHAASAESLRYESGVAESHILNAGPKYFAQHIGEIADGKFPVQNFYGSLQTLGESGLGIRDGVLHIGAVAPMFHGDALPVNAFVTRLPVAATKSVALSAASTEFVLLHCEPCRNEYTQNNQTPLVMFSNPAHMIITAKGKEPVDSVEDLAGRRMRSAGDYFRDWIESFGAVPVAVLGSETFEAFSSGIIDGTIGGMPDVSGFQLVDVISSVTTLAAGSWHSASLFSVRRDFWQSLPEDDRVALVDLAIDSSIRTSIATDNEHNRVLAMLDESPNATVIEPSEALLAAQEEFAKSQVERAASANVVENGVELGQLLYDLTIKWGQLVDTIDATDPAQIRALLDAEIYSKVDKAALGM